MRKQRDKHNKTLVNRIRSTDLLTHGIFSNFDYKNIDQQCFLAGILQLQRLWWYIDI